MLQVVSTGTVYPPVVTTGGFLLLEHTTRKRGIVHCIDTRKKTRQSFERQRKSEEL